MVKFQWTGSRFYLTGDFFCKTMVHGGEYSSPLFFATQKSKCPKRVELVAISSRLKASFPIESLPHIARQSPRKLRCHTPEAHPRQSPYPTMNGFPLQPVAEGWSCSGAVCGNKLGQRRFFSTLNWELYLP